MDIEKVKQEFEEKDDDFIIDLYANVNNNVDWDKLWKFIEQKLQEAYEAGKKEAFKTIIKVIEKKGDVYRGSDYIINVLNNHNAVGTTDYKEHSDIVTNNLKL